VNYKGHLMEMAALERQQKFVGLAAANAEDFKTRVTAWRL
jgi:hypothetical protein